ncbi:MAG: hypothetical protein ACKOHM_08245 [Spartobacteria bacterium]
MQDIRQTLRAFYKNPAVRARILEFLGGKTPATATCDYITADGVEWPVREPRMPDELFHSLEEGLDICRSLSDRESLIAHLDIEYVNFDFAAEAYLDPKRTFELQEPVARAIHRILEHCGIHALHVLSGRGHHYVWRIRRNSPVFSSLCDLGSKAAGDVRIPAQTEKAFAGLGLVMEFFGRLILEMARPHCRIPIELTAVEVAPSQRGREMISIDLSEYGDPLPTRTVRVPFSGYLKPWQQSYAVGEDNIGKIGPIIFVPADESETEGAVAAMRDPERAARWAEHFSTDIPDATSGTGELIREYETSALRGFHDFFYSRHHDPVASWPHTYDRTPLQNLPEGVRDALLFPNDLLLRPTSIRAVTETLVARGWHPRHVAGLLRSKFERDYGWGNQWKDYSPSMRADFYVRIFSGLKTSVAEDAAAIAEAELEHLPRPHFERVLV